MEFSRPLAIESFSSSWLMNGSSPLDVLHRASLTSNTSSAEEAHNFKFDVPISEFSESLVHADQLFSDGLIKPVEIKQSNREASNDLLDVATSCSSVPSTIVVPTVRSQFHLFKRWKKSSKRILQKCFGYLRPLRHKITGTRKSTRVDDIDRRARQVNNWSKLPQSPPYMACNSRNSWSDIESSIQEAVLHCKKSIDK